MGGEILIQVTVAEARSLKKKPAGCRKLRESGTPCLDLGQMGLALDIALEEVASGKGLAAAALAVSLEDDFGGEGISLRHLGPAKTKAVAAALAQITPGQIISSHEAAGLSREEFEELGVPLLRDLALFYKQAAERGAAVLKTIY